MEINITLVIQIINFAIAWFILHACYFKPAITYIYDTDQAYDRLQQTLTDWQGKITQKEHALYNLWFQFKGFSKQHVPEVVLPITQISNITSESKLSVDAHEVNQLAYILQDTIIKEVSNVDL